MRGCSYLIVVCSQLLLFGCIEKTTKGGAESSSTTVVDAPPADPTPTSLQTSAEMLKGTWSYGRVVCDNGDQLDLDETRDRLYISPAGITNVVSDTNCALNVAITSVTYNLGSVSLTGATAVCKPTGCFLKLGIRYSTGQRSSVTTSCRGGSSDDGAQWDLGDDRGETVLFRSSVVEGVRCTKVYRRTSLDDPGFDNLRTQTKDTADGQMIIEFGQDWGIGVFD